MVLRCSVLGHDYGDAEVEREREERGSEVVVTVQEYEECTRCGDRNVISENTEVTSLSTQAGEDALDGSDPESDATVTVDGEDVVEASIESADDSGTEDADSADADAVESDGVDVPTDDDGEPITDDGEILEDDAPADRDRDHGEWPDSDDVGPPVETDEDPSEWPDSGDGDDPIESDEVTDDAVVLEDDTAPDLESAESPVAADARSVTAEPPNAAGTQEPADGTARDGSADDGEFEPGTGIERAESASAPGRIDGPREDAPTEFYCPRCEYVASDDRGSLRAGDICPECRKGYLGERERR